MKKLIITLFFGILIHSCSVTKTGKRKIIYFDQNNLEISKSKFNSIRTSNNMLEIPGDSIHHKKLTIREKQGRLNDRKKFELLLKKAINIELDSEKPIVIIYHPGKDRCNSGGTATKESLKFWFEELEDGINQVARTKPIYLYKDNTGLEKYDGVLTWHQDPEGLVERLFFEHHYPCSSFVVISKEGNYVSYFGEFSKKIVWRATELMNE